MKITTKNVIITAIVIITIAISTKRCSDMEDQLNLYEAAQDTIQYYKDKNGNNVARIKTLQATSANALLKMETQDESIKRLQQLVKDNKKKLKNPGSSATTMTIETVVHDTIPVISSSGDTIVTGVLDKEGWVVIGITADAKNKKIELDSLKIRNEVDLIIGHDKPVDATGLKRLFAKREAYADVTLKNPYSNVTEFRTFNVTEKKHNWVVSPGVGYGIGSNGLTPFVGITLGYKLIEL